MIFKWQLILAVLAGRITQQQRDTLDFLMAEDRVLKEQLDKQLGGRRLLLTNQQRRRLALGHGVCH